MKNSPNPVLKKLGFSPTDRVVIIHSDDIGMCHATIDAYAELDEGSKISSGAVMVPCPWFLAVVDYYQFHPDTDLGIHLTLNAEWKTYRWAPLSTVDPASGLIDEQGFFYHRFEEPQELATPEEVALELEAQIHLAFTAGMKPTHVDSHMLTVLHPKFLQVYLETAYQFGLPAMVPRWGVQEWLTRGFDLESSETMATIIKYYEEQGYPLLDHFTGLKLLDPTNRMQQAKQALANLPTGLSHFYIHPSKDTPEARAISPDWQGRVADFDVFMDEQLSEFLKNEGFQVIGYRALLDLMP